MSKLNLDDLIGKKFNRLTVVKSGEDYISPKGEKKRRVYCQCECGNPELVLITITRLTHGIIKSCGCLQKEKVLEICKLNRRQNTYDLTGEYGIGYTRKGEEFYFDLEDYEIINKYSWSMHHGYIETCIGEGKNISMQRLLIMDCPEGMIVDHISRKPCDNRKSNLRICRQVDNCKNKSLLKRNASGMPGVWFNKTRGKWQGEIKCDKERISLGLFTNKADAINARKLAEYKYFKEYRPTGRGLNN